MAKSTKAQEVSTGTPDSYTEHELSDEQLGDTLRSRPMLGGELKSAGTSLPQSSGSESTSSGRTKASHQAPALTTESRSSQQATGTASSADSTVGAGRADLSPSDKTIVKPASPKSSKEKARATAMDDDDFAALQ